MAEKKTTILSSKEILTEANIKKEFNAIKKMFNPPKNSKTPLLEPMDPDKMKLIERIIEEVAFQKVAIFQSTLPRRERRLFRGSTKKSFYFNPRSREGSDDVDEYLIENKEISIHAPAKGATRKSTRNSIAFRISIHAPAKGATSLTRDCKQTLTISIHAPAKGATFT